MTSEATVPHDVTETAKVAKILISTERRNIGQPRGKTLDGIEIGVDDSISIAFLKPVAASAYIVLRCDNIGAVKLGKNQEFHKRSKHIDTRYLWIR